MQEEKKGDTSWEEEGDTQDQHQKTDEASKAYNQSDQPKVHAQSMPTAAVISKHTIEELKDLLRESSLITSRTGDGDQHNIASTFMLLPKSSEKQANKKERSLETFRPHYTEGEEKIKNEQENDEKWPSMPVHRPACNVYEEHQSPDGKPIKGSNAKQHIDFPVSSSTSPGDSSKGTEVNTTDRQRLTNLVPQIEQIKQQIAHENIHFIRFEATDLHGVSRSKTIPARFFQEKAIYGVFMPRSYLELTLNPKDNEVDSISASNYNGDIVLLPDLSTFRVIPWAEKMARVICDSYSIRGNPLLTSPRHILKRQLSQLQDSGLSLYSAFTYEFCIYGVAEIVNSKTIFLPAATLLNDHDQPFIQQLIDGMYHMGVNIESFSASTGPGQVEISFHPDFGIRVADNAFTFRTGMKEIAKKNGYLASFFTETGFYNCGVLSHSLWDRGERRNLFHSGSSELTDIAKKWLSGLLLHSPALSCLVAPGISCRKRFLKEGKELQEVAEVTCGSNDNSCAYNVKCHGLKGTHIENNLGSATANPYLVLAATIAAGLDGIRQGLNAFDGVPHSPTLKTQSAAIPLKMEDALEALKEDSCINAALGEAFVRYFIAMKQYELETEELDTERNKFLEYFI